MFFNGKNMSNMFYVGIMSEQREDFIMYFFSFQKLTERFAHKHRKQLSRDVQYTSVDNGEI